MPQSLIQLPKEAKFKINGWNVIIHNHKVENSGTGIFYLIISTIQGSTSDLLTLTSFEKHGVGYESAIEYCAHELEHDVDTLAYVILLNRPIRSKKTNVVKNQCDLVFKFSKSVRGRAIASQYVEKIRSCSNWEDLYDEMQLTSKFQKEMWNRITREIKQCRKA